MVNTSTTVEKYMQRPYKIELYQDPESGSYVAEIPDLPGCVTYGDTIDEAAEMIEDAKRGWIELALERGMPIPEPRWPEQDYSGRFTLRVPKSLHRQAAERAEEEGVSLNQFVNVALAEAVGRRAGA